MVALKLLPLAFAACITVSPSGKLGIQTPKVLSFHVVDVGSGIAAYIARGPSSVKIEADEAVLPYIETTVDGSGVLNIRIKSRDVRWMRSGKIVAAIVTPTLDGVRGSGGSTIHAVMSAGRQCEVAGSGGSEITLAAVACEQLDVDLAGGSGLEAVGTAKKIVISASGGSKVKVRQVAASVVKVESSGGSEVRTFASAELTADLSGGSELYIAGHPPMRRVEASGGSQIVDIP